MMATENNVILNLQSGWADLNRRPPRPKHGALPTALHPDELEYNPITVITSRHMRIGMICLCLALLLCSCKRPADTPLKQSATPVQPTRITRTPFLPNLPTNTPTPILTSTATQFTCSETQGHIQEYDLVTIYKNDPFHYRIYLPPCYEQIPEDCYPVLYMLHGQTYNDDQWERLGAGTAADELIISGEAKPFIVVMPREDNTYGDIYREGFSYTLINELIPLIDSQYHACSGRAYHSIGGLSRGGAWAIHLGFMNWQLFGAIGAHSTPPFDGDLNRLPGWIQAIPPGDLPRIYVDSGDRDYFHADSAALDAQLTRYNVPHEWVIFEGMHDESYWHAHVEDYLRWYAAGWD
jgi:enterochelin esterase-like enzyme